MQAAWSPHDTRLILACAASLGVIVTLIGWLRVVPFLAILLGDIGLIIALGALLGGLVTESGAAARIVDAVVRDTRPGLLPWLVALAAMVIGLPLFFEVGLVIMIPVIFALAARAGLPVLRIAVPALAGLTTLHALVPPHPGPLIAIAALHADLGRTLGFGLLIAIPAAILAGPVYGNALAHHVVIGPMPIEPAPVAVPRRSLALSIAVILLPVALMLCRTLAKLGLLPVPVARTLDVVGEPVVALTLSVTFALVTLGWGMRNSGLGRVRAGETMRDSLAPIAVLLLTIGAGGGFKQVLVIAGISRTVAGIAAGTHMPVLVLAWLVAVLLRQATGSATVATTTTAGLLAPLLPGLHMSPDHVALLVLAIGAGSVFFCHVNDAGFWMVREFFALRLRQTLLVWSVLQTIVSVVGLAGASLLWWLTG
ncbi:GntP family permease [Lichenicoccus roseus]|uniref:Gluconate transporter n=1 Tax=Lichenicoccus roseus TaxID=2683649 RepID=A0A5R9J349_9PROT|nr:gluconate:H+ symporter [Lichenicoccus roseus]TLU72060.1 gluconate transporter [Lichenicoccus roseus]